MKKPCQCHSSNIEKTGASSTVQTPRRRFLKSAASAVGGATLGLHLSARAEGTTAPAASEPKIAEPKTAEAIVSLPAAVLAKVGGFEIVETETDKIILVRADETSIVACSAVCPHKGCLVEYSHDRREFVCPCHRARFSLEGKVLKGPAKTDLKAYNARFAVGLAEKKVADGLAGNNQ